MGRKLNITQLIYKKKDSNIFNLFFICVNAHKAYCNKLFYTHSSVQSFSSVTQSCPTLCDPMNCSMPGLPALTHTHKPEKNLTLNLLSGIEAETELITQVNGLVSINDK